MKYYTLRPEARPAVRLVEAELVGIESGWMPWPSPDALAESVRGWVGAGADAGGQTLGDLQSIPICGPWLVGIDVDARPMAQWVPAPADAWLEASADAPKVAVRTRLVPQAASGAASDLPDDLLPTGLATSRPRGPAAAAVAWWCWTDMLAWLAQPEDTDRVRPTRLGLPPFTPDLMGPIALARPPADWKVDTGPVALLAPPPASPRRGPRGDTTLRLALGFGAGAPLAEGWSHVAGEGHPFAIDEHHPATGTEGEFAALSRPEVSPTGGRVRVILLTPGAFARGALPCPERLAALGVRLVATVVGRPHNAPGWPARDGEHRPCRRLAPAGSVYWLDVLDGDAGAWARAHQFDSLCDLPQDRLDGLGQFVVGVA